MLKTRSIPLNGMGEARNNTTIIQTEKADEVVLSDVRNRIRVVHNETSGTVVGGKDNGKPIGELKSKESNS